MSNIFLLDGHYTSHFFQTAKNNQIEFFINKIMNNEAFLLTSVHSLLATINTFSVLNFC